MRFKLGVKRWLLIAGILSQPLVNAKEVVFSISPTICIVNKMGEPCTMTVNVNWQTPNAGDYCLYQDTEQLTCWQNTASIATRLNIHLQQNMVFSLREQNTILAQKQIRVNASAPRKFRRKLRAQWSVF
ncbi:DUF3019 domain-containing protein [Thalassotalea sp. 1_MG-2023]|uniref:DUF3019 domain-containing protein n=1 Tax=Thalassotalea sp. 1_MG-2023 TaxID=3062680 RepID=UPI0026E3514F|nr:DUF3019 domain-containing protein [Thalassotalea sp. 1_MG-2023]MDO6427227.1 DUF3019 domain-containing protein [Thalassotalea sp. 1_MG-2023]